MSGTIIEFRRYKNLRNRRRGARPPLQYNPNRQARFDQQIARIEALLEELEEMGLGATDAAKTRDTESHDILALPPGHPAHLQDDPDPQPQVDRRILERMYCLLESRK
jgi:hypothetical protein